MKHYLVSSITNNNRETETPKFENRLTLFLKPASMNTMTIDVAAYLTMKQDLDKLKKENEKLTQRLEDKEDPDSWWESQYYECRDELHQAHIREAKLKHENVKVEKDNDKLEKEISVLLAVASGDYNRADDFKALCKERFEEEFIDACDDDTLVGQYFTE